MREHAHVGIASTDAQADTAWTIHFYARISVGAAGPQ